MRYHSRERLGKDVWAGLNRLTGRQLAAVRASLPAPAKRPPLMVPARALRDDEQLEVRVGPTQVGTAPQHSTPPADGSDDVAASGGGARAVTVPGPPCARPATTWQAAGQTARRQTRPNPPLPRPAPGLCVLWPAAAYSRRKRLGLVPRAAGSWRCDKSGSARSGFDSLNLHKINCQ